MAPALTDLLVGTKIILAIVVGKSKTFYSKKTYIYIMRFISFILCFCIGSFSGWLETVAPDLKIYTSLWPDRIFVMETC